MNYVILINTIASFRTSKGLLPKGYENYMPSIQRPLEAPTRPQCVNFYF